MERIEFVAPHTIAHSVIPINRGNGCIQFPLPISTITVRGYDDGSWYVESKPRRKHE